MALALEVGKETVIGQRASSSTQNRSSYVSDRIRRLFQDQFQDQMRQREPKGR